MEEKLLAEILAAHASGLNEGRNRKGAFLSLFPAYRDQLEPLLGLAERAKDLLVPRKPSAAFRRALGQDLVAAARQMVAQEARRPARRPRPMVLWGAAALSLAGLLALFLHLRPGERIPFFPSS